MKFTKRQKQIIEHRAKGHTYAAIASHMGIKYSTIRVHAHLLKRRMALKADWKSDRSAMLAALRDMNTFSDPVLQ